MRAKLETALRVCSIAYVAILIAAISALLLPFLGWWESLAAHLGPDAALRWGLGLALAAVLLERFRLSLLKRRQAVLARALLRLDPRRRHDQAIEILIDALESADAAVAQSAREELQRITGEDHGPQAAAWRRWFRTPSRHDAPVGRHTTPPLADRNSDWAER